jgi:hypothetical protein
VFGFIIFTKYFRCDLTKEVGRDIQHATYIYLHKVSVSGMLSPKNKEGEFPLK